MIAACDGKSFLFPCRFLLSMPIPGFVEYKRREFCKDVQCPIQKLLDEEEEGSEKYEKIREICKNKCLFSTYDFHHWLIEKGFIVARPAEN
jgi:hypothetical protein